MAISESDIKRLWGAAAALCSKPGCNEPLLPILEKEGTAVLGEMAHVIPASADGPRGDGKNKGEDTYENLILLCPTHHRLVDKAPGDFPRDLLLEWKEDHEASVRTRLRAPRFGTRREVAIEIGKLLAENYAIWRQFGPESEVARSNPFSTAAGTWAWFKIGRILPNNERATSLLELHQDLFTEAEFALAAEFMIHARAFSRSAYRRQDRDAVPRFPSAFADMIRHLSA